MSNGYFSFVLHAHLPYVRHEEENRLEERWLFEAMTETYIPLLWAIDEGKVKDGITISFTPPLMEMLADPLMQERYLHYLLKTEELLRKEATYLEEDQTFNSLIPFYQKRYRKIRETFLNWDKNVLKAYKQLNEQGYVTLMTSAATHAFLPYVKTKAALRSQIREGIQAFESHFGFKPRGFWLPECAYAPGLDRILMEEGIRYTFVDEHTILSADPKPNKDSGAPIYSPHGLILFPRHTELSSKVWSSTLGYPGDPDYREFYRDIGYERDWDYIESYVHEDGIRVDTGLKYYRVTGLTEEKEAYNREWAEQKINAHASHYLKSIEEYGGQHATQAFPPYYMVAPFDAELFGHWWFEGPEWIGKVLEKANQKVSFVSPETYIDRHFQDFDTCHISYATWGRDGYGDVWLNPKNDYMYRHLHRLEQDIAAAVALHSSPTPLETRAIKQMIREWMLAASSDWAFIVDGDSAVNYAKERFHTHVNRFDRLKDRLFTKQLDTLWLGAQEQAYPFLKEIDETVFLSKHDSFVQNRHKNTPIVRKGRTILMLSWEFPPMMVGGLSRHVYDLSRALVQDGHTVHVLTSAVDGYPAYETNQGVHVHRISGLQPEANTFFDWVGSLNVAMAFYGEKLSRTEQFDVIHAHDWLVGVAAKALKTSLKVPLLATIHATEHGRNNGIHSELQYEINQKEWELTYEADRVVVCSDYMKNELQTIFSLPEEKLSVIPNGVDLELIRSIKEPSVQFEPNERFTVFTVGRMVKEKGFQTVIDAAELLRERGTRVQFVLAGKGPMLREYQEQVRHRNLEEYVIFLGFISDEERNKWFTKADAAIFPSLYEPFGIVALEGMAAGKPTIVSDVGGLSSIIQHGVNGLKMIPGDRESLVAQVMFLYNHPISREGLATQGLRDVETKFDWGAIAKQTEREFEMCLAGQLVAAN
ncbi:1,4-alpha-glucan branching protein domain-containing protein [Alkalihalophilus lindianensis]|uniref:1,4-alpha-glucan branching protein domain-containing protein n=1 Tax=Alkalihalophilus lindianensis TaxID=1630542 RepID=A0ABU3X5L4_9BACI|nr:1,4-alpha-glucan branching protein domain-containing protein [Alkalihalophilus lindianensis]MDV2683175.1 1,4-alpha-glucan branching protein domain-containing protein [Alkalihalophilus lindianensis]